MKRFLCAILLFYIYLFSDAQTNSNTESKFSLQEAINYATENNISVKNILIDKKITQAQKNDLFSRMLPQINANIDYNHYINVQSNILENTPGTSFYQPSLEAGAPFGLKLGLANQFLPSVTATQVIFDKSYFSSLGTGRVLKEISDQNIKRVKIDVAYNVVRAYYSVLVNEKQLAFIETNLLRIDSSYKETYGRFVNGLARKLEVDQIEVSYNNLKEQKIQVANTVELSRSALKYQMNLPRSAKIILTDNLDESLLNEASQIPVANESPVYSKRIEYSILQNQERYNMYDLRSARGYFFPRLNAIAGYGYNPAATHSKDLTQSGRWSNYSYVGFRLIVPIFNGLSNHYKVQQKKMTLKKTVNSKEQLERSIDLEIDQSLIGLSNSVQSVKIQKRNVDLAEENLRVLKGEYALGIAINLQVTTAESSLKEAQTNYYNALYNALLYKADYDRATGNLIK